MSVAKEVHTVFVYGTLKYGEPNHNWFSKQKDAYYKFICNAKTEEKYPLVIATKYNIPFLLYSPGKKQLNLFFSKAAFTPQIALGAI